MTKIVKKVVPHDASKSNMKGCNQDTDQLLSKQENKHKSLFYGQRGPLNLECLVNPCP